MTTDNVSEAYLNRRKELTTLDLSLRETKALFFDQPYFGPVIRIENKESRVSRAASSPLPQGRRRSHVSSTVLAWKRNCILASRAIPLNRLRGMVHRTTCILPRKKPRPWGVSETAIPRQIPSSPPLHPPKNLVKKRMHL